MRGGPPLLPGTGEVEEAAAGEQAGGRPQRRWWRGGRGAGLSESQSGSGTRRRSGAAGKPTGEWHRDGEEEENTAIRVGSSADEKRDSPSDEGCVIFNGCRISPPPRPAVPFPKGAGCQWEEHKNSSALSTPPPPQFTAPQNPGEGKGAGSSPTCKSFPSPLPPPPKSNFSSLPQVRAAPHPKAGRAPSGPNRSLCLIMQEGLMKGGGKAPWAPVCAYSSSSRRRSCLSLSRARLPPPSAHQWWWGVRMQGAQSRGERRAAEGAWIGEGSQVSSSFLPKHAPKGCQASTGRAPASYQLLSEPLSLCRALFFMLSRYSCCDTASTDARISSSSQSLRPGGGQSRGGVSLSRREGGREGAAPSALSPQTPHLLLDPSLSDALPH